MSFLKELKRRNVLRVGAAYVVGSWLLIQVAETIFPLFGYGDTPARMVVIVLAIAFIPSLIFSWAFEITPEGLKRDADVDRDLSVIQTTGKKLERIILVVLALALAYFAFDKFVLDPVRDADELATATQEAHQEGRSEALVDSYGDNSIAVLPFVNMSSDPEQEYFSDGISEELLNLLSKIPELRVISRSSSFAFKGEKIDIPTVAKKLNVAHVLEGSVRKAGNQVRITAQLIDARTDTHLWSETYDRELENIFDVQDEISEAIVGALKESLNIQLETAPKTITATNTEAHDAYLRGRHLVVQRTPTTIEAAVHEFEKAITLDPDFALAHAELAMALGLLPAYGDLSPAEAMARAIPHVERALALDPNLAEAHAAMGFLLWLQLAYEEALVHFEQAIQFNPNYSIVYTWMAQVLGEVGRYDEEFAAAETALRLNPLSNVASINYVHALMRRDRLKEADRVLENMASIDPVFYAYGKGRLMAIGGKWANFALGNLDALQINPEFTRRYLPNDLALMGLEREALSVFETIDPVVLRVLGRPKDAVLMAEKRVAENPVSVVYRSDLGLALAAAGDYVHARPLLEEMWQRRGGQVNRGGLMQIDHAAALIAIRRDAGDEIGVDEILAAIKDNVRRYREAGYTNGTSYFADGTSYLSADYEEGVAAYLAGEREQGLVLIAKAADDGYFILPNEAYLQTLYDDPGFAPIIARQEARQARERKRFLDIVCVDNPYEAVWHPAEGTCERFAAEQENDSLQ